MNMISNPTPQHGIVMLPKVRRLLKCPAKSVFLGGPRGSGKTTDMLLDFAKNVGRGFGHHYKGLLIRREFKDLKEIQLKARVLFKDVFKATVSGNSPMIITFPGGEMLIITHLKDETQYSSVHGHEYQWFGVDEITTYPDLFLINKIKSSCRSKIGIPIRHISTGNPWGLGRDIIKDLYKIGEVRHSTIIKNTQLKSSSVYIYSDMFDNKPFVNNRGGRDYLRELNALPEELKNVWLRGSWDYVVANFFKHSWKQEHNIVKPFKIPKRWRCYKSFDWGYSKPYSCGFWAVSNGSDYIDDQGQNHNTLEGDVFRIGEDYGCEPGKANVGIFLTPEEIGDSIKRTQYDIEQKYKCVIKMGPADNQIFSNQVGQSIEQRMKINWDRSDKSSGSIVSGLALEAAYFKGAWPSKHGRDNPGLKIFNTCNGFIRTIPLLMRAETAVEELEKHQENHINDETRYFLTWLISGKTMTQKTMNF